MGRFTPKRLRRFRGETHPGAPAAPLGAPLRTGGAAPRGAFGEACAMRGGYWGGRRLQNGADCPPLSLPCRTVLSAGGYGGRRRPAASLALRAERADLGFVGGQRETGLGHAFCQLAAHGGIGQLGHRPAAGTDHQQIMRRAAGVVAGAPGIDGVQAVDQALVHQEIQRPIDGRRRRAGCLRAWRPAIRFRLRPWRSSSSTLRRMGVRRRPRCSHSASATLSWAPTVSLRESGA